MFAKEALSFLHKIKQLDTSRTGSCFDDWGDDSGGGLWVQQWGAAPAAGTPAWPISRSSATGSAMSDRSAAQATYGHIRSWNTSQITDMTHLFCGCPSGGRYGHWNHAGHVWSLHGN